VSRVFRERLQHVSQNLFRCVFVIVNKARRYLETSIHIEQSLASSVFPQDSYPTISIHKQPLDLHSCPCKNFFITFSHTHVVAEVLLSPFLIHMVTKTSIITFLLTACPLKNYSHRLFSTTAHLLTNWIAACSSTPSVRFVTSHSLPTACSI
jgi:hypothetical protein